MADSETSMKMDRNLALEVVRVTEAAALAASRLMGRGDEREADAVAAEQSRYRGHCRHWRGRTRRGADALYR
jgi:fructose-1,6-bisphosphatase II / sedoheptulose-1,7-bisphosphatase